MCRFSTLFNFSSSSVELSNLEDEFLNYQMLEESDIPVSVWQSALVEEKEDGRQYYRMDVIWSYLKTKKHTDSTPAFPKLAEVALTVLTLPHSNAEEERLFSLVTKNKTKFRPNLKLDGTLSSILTIKLATNNSPCSKYEPTKEVLDSARKATMEYNHAHSSRHT